jgi:class 3 adenylate cyclase
MMSRRAVVFQAIFFVLLVLVPILLVRTTLQETGRVRQEQALQDLIEQNHRELLTVSRSLTPNRQLSFLLARLIADVSGSPGPREGSPDHRAFWLRRLKQSPAAHLLRHVPITWSIASYRAGTPDVSVLGVKGAGEIPFLASHTRRLLACIRQVVLEKDPDAGDHRRALWQAFKDDLGAPVVFEAILATSRGKARSFATSQGEMALFWDVVPIGLPADGRTFVFQAVVDLDRLPADLVPRSQRLLWDLEDQGEKGLLLVSGSSKNKTVWPSRTWRKWPELRAFRPVRGKRLISTARLDPETYVSFYPVLPGGEFSLAIARRQTGDAQVHVPAAAAAAFGVLLCLLLWIVGELLAMGRLPAPSVTTRILGVYLTAALLPVSLGFYFSTTSAVRLDRRLRYTAQRQIRSQFERLEDGAVLFSARFKIAMDRFLGSPRFARRVRSLEAEFRKDRNPDRLNALLKERLSAIQNPEHPVHRLPDGGRMPVTNLFTLFLIGPDRLHALAQTVELRDPRVVLKFFTGISTVILNNLNPELQKMERAVPGLAIDQGKLVIEFMIDILVSLIGFDGVSKLFNEPGAISSLPVGTERFEILSVPLWVQRQIRFMTLIVWGGDQLDIPYLQDAIGRTAFPDDQVVMSIDQVDQHKNVSRSDIPPSLMQAGLKAMESHARVVLFDEKHQAVLQAGPSRAMNRQVLAAMQPLAPLRAEQQTRQRTLWARLLMVLSLAFVLGLLAAAIFVLPIRELTRSIHRVAAGDFDVAPEIPDRNEFGFLASTLGTLIRGLREGRILGRFVSEPVREAARQGNLDRLAGEARAIEATVAFCGLAGFDQFRKKATPEQLTELLRAHLERTAAAAGRFQGQIDKIIGEKVMLVFDHRRFATQADATRAALDCARSLAVGDELAESTDPAAAPAPSPTLPVIIGMTTGQVLSGILGSPKVRLDYTVIGDIVNLAARLVARGHELNGPIRVAVDGHTLELAGQIRRAVQLPISSVRGKKHQVEVFHLGA